MVAPGRGGSVPSLVASALGAGTILTASSQIGCGDCHASDSGPGAGGSGPRGPHGSTFPHLLERNYATADGTPESPQAYALCYKCHAREVLLCPPAGDGTPLSDQVCATGGAARKTSTFPLHARHVKTRATPCSACHASHGVSSIQGNPVNNAHLVDFDVSIVRPNAAGLRQYVSRGAGAGSCALSCHGHEHDAASSAYAQRRGGPGAPEEEPRPARRPPGAAAQMSASRGPSAAASSRKGGR